MLSSAASEMYCVRMHPMHLIVIFPAAISRLNGIVLHCDGSDATKDPRVNSLSPILPCCECK
jgi:hypothetical protein